MKSAKEAFAEYLAREGLKMTPQRRIILETFMTVKDHVSSEELYAMAKKTDPAIGQATVYRTMKLLENSKLAEAVDFGDGFARYEPHFGQDHHDHLICENCGKNVEVLDPDIERLQEEAAARYGFSLSRHKMYLFGLCEDCR
ncbi:MAG: transcriptional repressor [Proteobacteria bacterium]|nr:transcriptional repressor [Pseudomonadota bacterium]MBU1612656.1 transcriptional repressor [Pseudomonadota bacterium]